MPKELNPERKLPIRQATQAEAEAGPPDHPLVTLGRQLGNAQIARMLAQRAAPEEDELQLSREGDEDEDDLQLSRDPAAQRASPEEDELQLSRESDEDEDELQLSRDAPEVGLEGGPVSDATAGQINRLRGGGSALDEGARGQMEQSLGADFSDVRVHTGAESAQLNRSLGAKAFTTGNDVFFGASASPRDSGLLAHELTHVVQQRSMGGGGPMTVGPADDAYEAEAEATAKAVSGGAAPAQRQLDKDGA